MRTKTFGIVVAGLVVGFVYSGLACINTSYSRKHEQQITGDGLKIIMGQFARHGSEFYEEQLSWNRWKLESDPGNPELRNDLAAALLKLKRHQEAHDEFQKIEKSHPGRYKTYANLGVLFKKAKQYQKAADYTRMALEAKPEGHLGLGDYYLKMLHWRAAISQNPDKTPIRNFLGIKYSDGAAAVAASPLVDETYLKTLIIADHHFADAYVVYGDLLMTKDKRELAYRCYLRALQVNDGSTPKKAILSRLGSEETIRGEFLKQAAKADQWVRSFQEAEGDLAQVDHAVDFETVKRRMTALKIPEPKYLTIFGTAVSRKGRGSSEPIASSRNP